MIFLNQLLSIENYYLKYKSLKKELLVFLQNNTNPNYKKTVVELDKYRENLYYSYIQICNCVNDAFIECKFVIVKDEHNYFLIESNLTNKLYSFKSINECYLWVLCKLITRTSFNKDDKIIYNAVFIKPNNNYSHANMNDDSINADFLNDVENSKRIFIKNLKGIVI